MGRFQRKQAETLPFHNHRFFPTTPIQRTTFLGAARLCYVALRGKFGCISEEDSAVKQFHQFEHRACTLVVLCFLWIIPLKKDKPAFLLVMDLYEVSVFFQKKTYVWFSWLLGWVHDLEYAHWGLVEVIDLRGRPKVCLVWKFSRSWLNNLLFENWHGHLNISANCNSTKNRLSLFWIYQFLAFWTSMFVQWSGAMHAVGCHFFTTSGLCHHSCWVWILEQSCLLQVLLFWGVAQTLQQWVNNPLIF